MKKFYAGYNRFEKILVGVIMLLLIIMGFVQVLFRFVLHMPLAWTEELLTFCMIWVAYLGASAAANERKHILVSMFVDLMPKRMRLAFTILSQLLWLACAIVMTYLGGYVAMNYINRGAVTLGGKFPYWVAAIIIPISMALVAIRVVVLIVHTLKGESDTRSQEEIVREEMDT
jgi:TRAP-type C4-dicarboxylate transport system permease small subunit